MDKENPKASDLKLDSAQREAVEHVDGACMVLAGPGSGKTRVIIERLLALHRNGVPLDQIRVLTYTVKAAEEMVTRAAAGLPGDTPVLPLSNFHSFARSVLREWGWVFKIPSTFRPVRPAEAWLIARGVLEDLQLPTLWNPLRPHDLIEPLLDLVGSAKQELVTPEMYASWAAARDVEASDDPVQQVLNTRHGEIGQFYFALSHKYRQLGVLDYDDEILFAERVLRESPAARSALCGHIRYVMVDEYQDTNLAQARLVESLVAEHGNVMVVADDDQSIYKFRGASLANLSRFERQYPECKKVVLGTNYRSTPEIVAVCQSVITQASPELRQPKEIRAERHSGASVDLWHAPTVQSECAAIAAECRKLIDEGMAPSSIAWLFSRHADMRAPELALREAGVPFRVSGGRGFFVAPEIKDLLSLLQCINDPHDTQSFVACLHLPHWRVSNRGRIKLVAAANASDVPLAERILDAKDGVELGDLDPDDLAIAQAAAGSVVDLHAQALHCDIRDLIFDAFESSGFFGIAELNNEAERLQAGANLNKFSDILETFADWSNDTRLGSALDYIEAMRNDRRADEMAQPDVFEDAVSLMTTHGSKGLEFPVVFISHCAAFRWPGRGGVGSMFTLPDELIEEAGPIGDVRTDEVRRLFYVAATRAQDRLIFSWSDYYEQSFKEETPTVFLKPALEAESVALRNVEYVTPRSVAMPRSAGSIAHRQGVGVRDLRDFAECPRKYEYRRRYAMPTRQSVQQWYGTLIHGVLEQAARMRNAGEPVDADRVAAMWQTAWESTPGPKGRKPELRAYGEQSMRAYVATPAWTDRVIAAVESDFSFSANPGEVRGRFDRIDIVPDNIPVVVDYKTGPPHHDPGPLARDLQVRGYAVALAAQEQLSEVDVELHYLQDASTTRVHFDAAALKSSRGRIGALRSELARAWESGMFPPKPTLTVCKRCDYRSICPESATPRSTTVAIPAPSPSTNGAVPSPVTSPSPDQVPEVAVASSSGSSSPQENEIPWH